MRNSVPIAACSYSQRSRASRPSGGPVEWQATSSRPAAQRSLRAGAGLLEVDVAILPQRLELGRRQRLDRLALRTRDPLLDLLAQARDVVGPGRVHARFLVGVLGEVVQVDRQLAVAL